MRYNVEITQEGDWFVARCLDVEMASQGRSVEESLDNLREAMELYQEKPQAEEASALDR